MQSGDLVHAFARGSDPTESNSAALVAWWSLTKSVLAAATLRLADQGRLSLDDLHRRHRYTIRQLLQHTAGVNTYGGAPYQAAVAAGDPPWPVAELLARVNAERLIFEPGQGWAYSNVGYLFIRQSIEETTGLGIDAALRQLVLGPLGVANTRIAATPEDVAQTLWSPAAGYDPGWVYHGLLIGPPSDAVDFLRRLFAEGFLSDGARAAMQTRHPLGGGIPGRPWTSIGYGLGLMMGEMGAAGPAMGHSGVGPFSVASLYGFPDRPGSPVIAVFGPGSDEGPVETETGRLAREL